MLQAQWSYEEFSDRPAYMLHDGPPFANGEAHMGHVLNKLLKDTTARYWRTQGYSVQFRPGFDTHGLPTELKVLQSLTEVERANLSPLELRQRCRELAQANVAKQSAVFQRLGVSADWENPYLTSSNYYEAAQLEALAQLLEQGYLFYGDREVWYSPSSQTVLAESELEYAADGTPLDWRTKQPVERRQMQQWFLDLSRMRIQALTVVDTVNWGSENAKTRFVSMLGDRPDWCVSRQRSWGLPLPAFYDAQGKPFMTPETVRHFAALLQEQGSDAWWTLPVAELLPASLQPLAPTLTKGFDTLDVWLDSGLSWMTVLNGQTADLYLEGSDQHRGWFQSSLLTSVALTGKVPFKTVLTHGFVLDGNGRKMSKSEGNVVSPLELLESTNADVLRLWALSGNYENDLRVSEAHLKSTTKDYLKFRQTLRFMLQNLFDFEPNHLLPESDLLPEDKAALDQQRSLLASVDQAYQNYRYNEVLRLLKTNLANLSNYFGTESTGLKPRLYQCYENSFNSLERRSGQSTLFYLLQEFLPTLEPVLPHLVQELRNHQ